MYRDGDQLTILGDLPGMEKSDLQIHCDGEVLTISAMRENKRFPLPEAVDEHSGSARFNNGVLEMTFDVRNPSAKIDID